MVGSTTNRSYWVMQGSSLLILLLAVASTALARTETLRWEYDDPGGISGFKVQVGPSSRFYNETIDIGMPAADADGVFSYDLDVADDATVWVALTAYSDVSESYYSNEQERRPDAAEPPADPGTDPGTDPGSEPGGSANPSELWSTDFEGLGGISDPPGWLDTQSNNSMTADDSLFRTFQVDSDTLFGTSSDGFNIHSHFVGAGSSSWSSYEYKGRMAFTDPDSGIGVTVYSQYPNTDEYYRVRRVAGTAFAQSSHPKRATACESDTAGAVGEPSTWYRFRIQVEPTSGATLVRAKVWPDGTSEPESWQIRCSDTRDERPESGTVGVWSMGPGNKYWDDLEVIDLSSGDPAGNSGGTPSESAPEPLGTPGRPKLIGY